MVNERPDVSTSGLFYWMSQFTSYIYVNQKLKHMTLQELKEQIQQDLLTYFDGMDNDTLDTVCQIVVSNFKQYEASQN